eukprot:362180-Chlamydomonas_euryale.AAC.5
MYAVGASKKPQPRRKPQPLNAGSLDACTLPSSGCGWGAAVSRCVPCSRERLFVCVATLQPGTL